METKTQMEYCSLCLKGFTNKMSMAIHSLVVHHDKIDSNPIVNIGSHRKCHQVKCLASRENGFVSIESLEKFSHSLLINRVNSPETVSWLLLFSNTKTSNHFQQPKFSATQKPATIFSNQIFQPYLKVSKIRDFGDIFCIFGVITFLSQHFHL